MENAGVRARKVSLFVRCRTVEFGAAHVFFWYSNIAVLIKRSHHGIPFHIEK